MHIHAYQVCGVRPGAGNPALVIENDGLDAAGAGPLAVMTMLRKQRLDLSQIDNAHYVALQPEPMHEIGAAACELSHDALRQMLRAPGLRPLAPPRIGSVGSPKLFVDVADTHILYGLEPAPGAIVG
jgi:hypothetical protein